MQLSYWALFLLAALTVVLLLPSVLSIAQSSAVAAAHVHDATSQISPHEPQIPAPDVNDYTSLAWRAAWPSLQMPLDSSIMAAKMLNWTALQGALLPAWPLGQYQR
jgi:hypothetical protein